MTSWHARTPAVRLPRAISPVWQGLLEARVADPGIFLQPGEPALDAIDREVAARRHGVEFIPRDRDRDRSARTCSRGKGRDRRRTTLIADVVDEDLPRAGGL